MVRTHKYTNPNKTPLPRVATGRTTPHYFIGAEFGAKNNEQIRIGLPRRAWFSPLDSWSLPILDVHEVLMYTSMYTRCLVIAHI